MADEVTLPRQRHRTLLQKVLGKKKSPASAHHNDTPPAAPVTSIDHAAAPQADDPPQRMLETPPRAMQGKEKALPPLPPEASNPAARFEEPDVAPVRDSIDHHSAKIVTQTPILLWDVRGMHHHAALPASADARDLAGQNWFVSSGRPCHNPSVRGLWNKMPPGLPTHGPDPTAPLPPIHCDRRPPPSNPFLHGDGINNCLICGGELSPRGLRGGRPNPPKKCPWDGFANRGACMLCVPISSPRFLEHLSASEQFDILVYCHDCGDECAACLNPIRGVSTPTPDGPLCVPCVSMFNNLNPKAEMTLVERALKLRQFVTSRGTWRRKFRHLEALFLQPGDGQVRCAECKTHYNDPKDACASDTWPGVTTCQNCLSRHDTALSAFLFAKHDLELWTFKLMILVFLNQITTDQCPRCNSPFTDRTVLLADFRWHCHSCEYLWLHAYSNVRLYFPLSRQSAALECHLWLDESKPDSHAALHCDVCGDAFAEGPSTSGYSSKLDRRPVPSRGKALDVKCSQHYTKYCAKEMELTGIDVNTPEGYRQWRYNHILHELPKLSGDRLRRASARLAIGTQCQWCTTVLAAGNSFMPHPKSCADKALCFGCAKIDAARCRFLLTLDRFWFYRHDSLKALQALNNNQSATAVDPKGSAVLLAYYYSRRGKRGKCPVTSFPFVFDIGVRFRHRPVLDHDHVLEFCRVFTVNCINSGNLVADIARYRGGWTDLNAWGQHYIKYLIDSHADAYRDHPEALSDFNAVFADAQVESGEPLFKLSNKKHDRVHEKATAGKNFAAWEAQAAAKTKICPMTSAPIREGDELRHDHSHQTGEARLLVLAEANWFTGCIESAADWAARAEYPGDDPDVYLGHFHRYLREFIEKMVAILMCRPEEVSALITAALEDPELRVLLCRHAAGDQVSLEPLLVAILSGVLRAPAEDLDRFHEVQSPTAKETLDLRNPCPIRNPRKGYFPPLTNAAGEFYYGSVKVGVPVEQTDFGEAQVKEVEDIEGAGVHDLAKNMQIEE
ncbi:hypothetical protein C8R46DRAFT_1359918 [Mycena filopes]|nr:hypothetical protein C8R46DRAFT_1359918 [Mycena filopes]